MIEVDLPGYHAATLDALVSMSEASLQAKIIEPLLRLMGFQHVRDMSGPNEKGKDLVATKLELGRPKLYAIQIKKFQASGKHTKSTAMTNVVTQLRQMLLEPVLDPMTHTQRIPDRGVFITPYAIHRDALSSAIEQVRDLERREVTIIDGPILVDLVLSHMPEAITDLDAQLRYRLHLARAANRIPELSVLGSKEEPSLEELFVELSATYGKMPLGSSAGKERGGSKITSATGSEVKELESLFRRLIKGPPKIWNPPKRALTAEESHRYANVLRSALIEVDLEPLLKAINSRLESYSIELAGAVRARDPKDLNRVIAKGIDLAKIIDSLLELEVVRLNWPELVRSARASSSHHGKMLFPATAVVDIEYPILITAEPGGGKTTLLRRLSQLIARTSKSQLPLLIPLVRIDEPTEECLVMECLYTLANLGYELDEGAFLRSLDEGKFRLLLDGLDEAGSGAMQLFSVIKNFHSKHKRCLIGLTCRDTLMLESWTDAVHLQLSSFTEVQLRSFVDRWFRAEPTARNQLNAWLNENPRMLAAARTPLIAALLCSLQHAQAEMPATEVELYEERFAMLLGRWELAKGIDPLSSKLRQRYWHLLMDLAIDMHLKERRSIDYAEAIGHARQLETEDFSAAAMLMDCTYRGIFLREGSGISFGHLTYQEFLAARWLSRENPADFILGKLGSPWWIKPLEFYAAIRGDITQIIKEALDRDAQDAFFSLSRLAAFAPLTRRGVLRELIGRKSYHRSPGH